MAVETTSNAIAVLEYDDSTTRTVTFTDTDIALVTYKTRVMSLNASLTGSDAEAKAPYRDTFISDDGYPIKRIKEARMITTETEVIYRG